MEPPPASRRRPAWEELDPELDGIDIDLDLDPEDLQPSVPLKKVPGGDLFEAARAGDCGRLRVLLEGGADVNGRDRWDSAALYYACLAGHVEAARMLLEAGAVCAERTFDGDRCHYAALNLRVRRLLKAFEARPPPLAPLAAALRAMFLACDANRAAFLEQLNFAVPAGYGTKQNGIRSFPSDITFFVDGRPLEAHRVILCARSPFFRKKFQTDWKNRKEVRFSSQKLSYHALYSLVHFFYSDRLEVAVDDMEDLVRTCKACKCDALQKILEKEMMHQKYADYKSLKEVDSSQRRFILQGLFLPEEDRLSSALDAILRVCLSNSHLEDLAMDVPCQTYGVWDGDDLADLCIKVGYNVFRCHQVVIASRSEYFRARLSRMMDFLDADHRTIQGLPLLEELDLSGEAFGKMIEYMYTDSLKQLDPNQAEEILDAASRYLLFPLKRAVADALLPHLELAPPAEICNWLMISDMYGVLKVREYCLDVMACNFEMFADTKEFRAMLLTLPPPSGSDSSRTTRPSAPGSAGHTNQGNILDDLRDKWLEAEAAELDKRDESALAFDRRMEMLVVVAEREVQEETDQP